MGGESGTARSVSFLHFVLALTEPGGVTVPGPAQVQALIDRGHDSRPHVPGTSLAGALRELVRERRGPDRADAWFGRLVPEGERSAEDVGAEASSIWVLGSRLLDGGDPVVLRSTAIDRQRGAARDNTLRADEVLPAGTSFEVFLRWDNATREELADLASLIAGWRPLLGRGASRGRGRCSAGSVRHGTLRLDSPDGLLAWLTLSGPELAWAVASTPVPAPDPAASALDAVCQVEVSIVGPWRTGNGEEKPEGDPIPMLRIAGQFVMPGTGIKGIVRSRAEYILRSVGMDVCDQQKCGQCWACQVFGYGGGDDDSSPAVGRRARIRFANAPIRGAGEPVQRMHVAIDRFTGGARDTALYAMEALEKGSFTVLVEPMGSMPSEQLAQVRAVLRLVFEDLNDGLIGMGGGTARGYGSVRVDFRTSGLPPLDEAQNVLAEMREGALVGG
jgi:CRISPR/Cas system CSM-associated protein Csm3 (group 7 of RAMP superfamily)